MPKQRFADYRDELAAQQIAWRRKPALRAVYQRWFAAIVARFSPQLPCIEIGAGSGAFKSFYPEVLATDAIRGGDWIDQQLDARQLPFPPASVGNFVLIDCLHHLPRPIHFLQQAAGALQPGGRIILLEPAATPWARLVWRVCHHEPVDLSVDFVAEAHQPEPDNPGLTYANMATAQALFIRDWARVRPYVPQLRKVECLLSDVLAYPLTGGFSYFSLAPAAFVVALQGFEAKLLPQWLAGWLGLRMLVVLERAE